MVARIKWLPKCFWAAIFVDDLMLLPFDKLRKRHLVFLYPSLPAQVSLGIVQRVVPRGWFFSILLQPAGPFEGTKSGHGNIHWKK